MTFLNIEKAAELIKSSKFLTVFTGAGISKESGIPIFRGENGIYSKYDETLLYINSYLNNTKESWKVIKEIFYDNFQKSEPNIAHRILAKWEEYGILKCIITQNIDNLHQEAGNKNVIEYHGNKEFFLCIKCKKKFKNNDICINENPPACPDCGGLLKPDFVFYGEPIPQNAATEAYKNAKKSDVHLIIGTTGVVQPASYIPHYAKQAGAIIIEINPEISAFTNKITDIFIKMPASKALQEIDKKVL